MYGDVIGAIDLGLNLGLFQCYAHPLVITANEGEIGNEDEDEDEDVDEDNAKDMFRPPIPVAFNKSTLVLSFIYTV